MREAQIQTLFSKSIRKDRNAVYELKLEKGKSMPFNKVAEHQLIALKQAKDGGLFHKLTDMPHFAGMKARFDKPRPFDCLTVYKVESYIGICFYEPRKPKEVILIDIDDFTDEMSWAKRKSLTKERAVEIATRTIRI